MRKTFTAQEFYDYLQEFESICAYAGENHMVVSATVSPKDLDVYQIGNEYLFEGNVMKKRRGTRAGVFSICAEKFECEIEVREKTERHRFEVVTFFVDGKQTPLKLSLTV